VQTDKIWILEDMNNMTEKMQLEKSVVHTFAVHHLYKTKLQNT
jgi:hypothetical protein